MLLRDSVPSDLCPHICANRRQYQQACSYCFTFHFLFHCVPCVCMRFPPLKFSGLILATATAGTLVQLQHEVGLRSAVPNPNTGNGGRSAVPTPGTGDDSRRTGKSGNRQGPAGCQGRHSLPRSLSSTILPANRRAKVSTAL